MKKLIAIIIFTLLAIPCFAQPPGHLPIIFPDEVIEGGGLLKVNNLSDLDSVEDARTNLGLGTMATQAQIAVNIDGGTIDDVDYLKAGGVGPGVSGLIELTSSDGVKVIEIESLPGGSSCHFGTQTAHDFYIIRNDTVTWRFTSGYFGPQTDNAYSFGDASHRVTALWSVNGTVQTSGREAKDDIVDSSLGLDFIKALSPKQYKWKDYDVPDELNVHGTAVAIPAHRKTFTRKHQGLIAEDIENVLASKKMTKEDFAGLVKEDGVYGLNYAEFIAPMIKAIQELSDKNDALEARIKQLEKR